MLGPVARSRVSLAAAVLLTTAAGGAVLAAEASPVAGPAGLSAPLPARVYGPVVPPPAPVAARRLLPAGALLAGTLLAGPQVPELERVAPAPVPTPATPEPPAPVVGPDSPPEQVREIQRLLNAAGASLVVDGAWGPVTERAVRAAQLRAGLPVDGRVGPATRASLLPASRRAG